MIWFIFQGYPFLNSISENQKPSPPEREGVKKFPQIRRFTLTAECRSLRAFLNTYTEPDI